MFLRPRPVSSPPPGPAAGAVVAQGEGELRALHHQQRAHPGGARVLDHVGERLLRDAVGGDFDGGGQGRHGVGRGDADAQLARFALGRQRTHRADQAKIVEGRRPQALH
jgi:hypothetical protein